MTGNELLRKSDTKSVSTSSAQSPTLCGVGLSRDYDNYVRKRIEAAARIGGPVGAFLVDMLLSCGVRVSEVLAVEPKDFLSPRQVIIRGLKGSRDRVCSLTVDHNLPSSVFVGGGPLSEAYSRFWAYRFCRSLCIYWYNPVSGHKCYTHAGRHLVSEHLLSMGHSLEDIQLFLGHKSIESTKYYAR